jgi:hypothetical protein
VARKSVEKRIEENLEEAVASDEIPIISPEQSPWDSRNPTSEEFVRAYIGSFSREPFQRQLAKFLQCGPDRHDIIAFAKRNPDKWAKTIQVFASLAGYTERMEIDINMNIQSMSDTQIEARLAELDTLLIDHSPTSLVHASNPLDPTNSDSTDPLVD